MSTIGLYGRTFYLLKMYHSCLSVTIMDFCYNIDWLQHYKHIQYSVGVVYLVFLNLPRSIRYKRQNVILFGVIPGPSEPSLSINSYLLPLVRELQQP